MSKNYLLKNGTLVTSTRWYSADIRVKGGKIEAIDSNLEPKVGETNIDCSGQFIYPGLINSHDHLAFNLFPRLGEPPYPNAYEWGEDLHRRWGEIINTIGQIPIGYRLLWGAWKNLFCGVTQVVHHDQYSIRFRFGFPIKVLNRYTFAHSLKFERNLTKTLARRREGFPFLIHLAEGQDELSSSEVACLHELGGLDERTVAVHAVEISDDDIELLSKSGTTVVWCPSSNIYLFQKTAPIDKLLGRSLIALGTDSTLTGNATMFDELRTARQHSTLTAKELFCLVTDNPRSIFRLPSDAGQLEEGGKADLFLVPKNGEDPYDRLLHTHPGDIDFLMKSGTIVYYDASSSSLKDEDRATKIYLNGRLKYVTDNRFPKMYRQIQRFLTPTYSYLSA